MKRLLPSLMDTLTGGRKRKLVVLDEVDQEEQILRKVKSNAIKAVEKSWIYYNI